MLEAWINEYGDSKESLCALRQGYKDNETYPETGWSKGALENANEFLDIKSQLDDKL